MNKTLRYTIGIIVAALIAVICWYFSSIVWHIVFAVLISILGQPLKGAIGHIKVKNWSPSPTLQALLTLTIMWGIIISFLYLIIPLLSYEFKALSTVNVEHALGGLRGPLTSLGEFLQRIGLMDQDIKIEAYLTQKITSILNFSKIGSTFGTIASRIAGTIGNLFVALFSVTFIGFFFLRDPDMFTRIVTAIVPEKFETEINNTMSSIRHLLARYFVGLLGQIFIIMVLNSTLLSFVGIGFQHAVVIGFLTGVMNIIPYLGPIMGYVVGLAIGAVTHLDLEFYSQMLPMLAWMWGCMLFTQLIDNTILQPLIYGNSVHAHPLEIFIVILIAGNVAGIAGMILAIPAYTVLRVILLQFFSRFRFVQKLTFGLSQHSNDWTLERLRRIASKRARLAAKEERERARAEKEEARRAQAKKNRLDHPNDEVIVPFPKNIVPTIIRWWKSATQWCRNIWERRPTHKRH